MSNEAEQWSIERRASEAESLLSNPLLQEAFEAVEKFQYNSILGTDVVDDVKNSKLILSVQILNAVKSQLFSHIETGKMVEKLTVTQKG
jgi:hypothetical protein